LPVVDRAQQATVVLGGEAAVGVLDDVVDVAALRGFSTAGEGAVAVAYLDGAPGWRR
jgi:hypothetical protein